MANLVPKYRKNAKGRKVLNGYHAEFYDPERHPKRKRVSLRTKDRNAARQKLTQLERQYMAGTFDPWTDSAAREGVTLTDAVRQFLQAKRDAKRREKTVRNYADILRLLEQHLPPAFPIGFIEERHIIGMLEARDLSETSKATYLRHLRSFFGWARTEGLTKRHPVPDYEHHRKQSTVPEFLTREQVAHLLRVIESEAVVKAAQLRRKGGIIWLADVIRFAVGTGLRVGELSRLQWSDVDRTTRFITVRRTKNHQERRVYVTGDAWAVLEQLHAARSSESDGFVFTGVGGGPLNANYASERFRHYRRMAGLPENIHFHSLRHTFASWAVLEGMDLYQLQQILGHNDVTMTNRYAHLQPEAQINDMERIFGASSQACPAATVAELDAEIRRLQAQRDRLQVA